jgi:hypothetical protein
MSFVGLLCSFVLGFLGGGAAGIVFGFAWYERKCGLLVDHSGKRALAIRAELDDVIGRQATKRRRRSTTQIRQRSEPETAAPAKIHLSDSDLQDLSVRSSEPFAVSHESPPTRSAFVRYFMLNSKQRTARSVIHVVMSRGVVF